MKKSLLALAAMGAFAGAAQAQSSVTVYGILDVGYVGGNERLSGPEVRGQRVTNQNFSTLGASAQSTSRLGFRGTEDLGGGTRAFFTVEVEVVPNGAVSAIGNSTGNRAAFAGLGQKGIGQFSIGLQNTLVTDAMSPTITGQFNNIVGSMLFPGGYDGGTRTADFRSADLPTVTTSLNRVNGNNEGFTFRATNMLKVQSDRFAGLQASAMWMQSGSTINQVNNTGANSGYTGGKNNQDGWGLGLNYTWQKLLVSAAYQSFKAVDPYIANATMMANGGITIDSVGRPAAFSTAGSGTNVTDNQTYVGATYDFGILKAYAGWVNRKVTSQINSNAYLKRTAQEIGVRANLTKTIEGWASVGNGRFQSFGNGEPTANLLGYQLGANYNLSKRSNLYAIYGQSGTSNVTTAAGATNSYRASQYAVGVRHTF